MITSRLESLGVLKKSFDGAQVHDVVQSEGALSIMGLSEVDTVWDPNLEQPRGRIEEWESCYYRDDH